MASNLPPFTHEQTDPFSENDFTVNVQPSTITLALLLTVSESSVQSSSLKCTVPFSMRMAGK